MFYLYMIPRVYIYIFLFAFFAKLKKKCIPSIFKMFFFTHITKARSGNPNQNQGNLIQVDHQPSWHWRTKRKGGGRLQLISMIITLGRTKRNNKAAKTQSSKAARKRSHRRPRIAIRCDVGIFVRKAAGNRRGCCTTANKNAKNTHVLTVLLRDL